MQIHSSQSGTSVGQNGPALQELPLRAQLACALRDIFLADNGEALARAVRLLASLAPGKGAPDLDPDSLHEAEFAFNRLFVGPMALEAPPYASIYLETEPLVMGATTMLVRELYHGLGLASGLEGRLPDDHVGLELDCAAALLSALVGDAAAATQDRDTLAGRSPLTMWVAYGWLVGEHMAGWVPQFVERIEAAPSAHPIVTWCARRLAGWLEAELSAVSGESGA